MIKPITPEEALKTKQSNIPPEVLKVFNELIVEKFKDGKACIEQDEASSRISKILKLSEKTVFELGFLDIEPLYEKAGWKVYYDKPGYNEDYSATFTFSIKGEKP